MPNGPTFTLAIDREWMRQIFLNAINEAIDDGDPREIDAVLERLKTILRQHMRVDNRVG